MVKAEIIKGRNTSEITKDDYLESVRLSTNTKKKMIEILLCVVLMVLGGYGHYSGTIKFGAIFGFIGAFMLVWELFLAAKVIGSRAYKKALAESDGKDIIVKIDFYKDHLDLKNPGNQKVSLKYKKINQLRNGKNVVVLLFNHDEFAVTFKKDSFTFGECDEIIEMINEARA